MSDVRPLAAGLLLDALSEFARVIDALPAPGRGGAIGRLNPGAVTLLHITRGADNLRRFAVGGERDPWLTDQLASDAGPPRFDEAFAAYHRARAPLASFLEQATAEELAAAPVPEPIDGLPRHLVGETLEYLVARTAAHVLVHAGELSALASLVGAPDLGLPGAMAATRGSEA